MIVKGITLLLVFLAVLAVFGRLRFPGRDRLASVTCPTCGRYRIGKGPCPCEKKKKG
jgi:hypothetical protein